MQEKGRDTKQPLTLGPVPMEYLGFPLTSAYRKASNFSSLIDNIRGMVDGWLAKNLYLAGTVELIKSVL